MLAILFYLLLLVLLIVIFNCFGFLFGLVFIILLYVISFILALIIIKRNNRFVQYFGVPGSGKTTIASAITYRDNKRKKLVYSNVPIYGSILVDLTTLHFENDIPFVNYSDRTFKLIDCTLIIDESGLEYNNRNWKKNFEKAESLDFFKKHRHYGVDIYMFSQAFNDSDTKLRSLTTELYLVKKSFYPFFIRSKEIKKCVGIDNNTKQIIDEYKFKLFSGNYYFMPKYWKKFNTHEK